MKTPLLCYVLFLSCIYVVSSTRLYALRATNGDGLALAHELNEVGFDIYGFYGDIVVASPHGETTDYRSLTSQVFELGEKKETGFYYVLERQERFGVVFAEALTISIPSATTLYSSFNRLVVSSTNELRNLDLDLEILPIPTKPIQLGIREDILPVVRKIYSEASRKYTQVPIPAITELVKAVNPADLKGFVTYLTGEDPLSNILTRNSLSVGAKDAAIWIQKHFELYELKTSTMQFRADYSSNVIGIKEGQKDPSKIVIVGAHYDSRGPSSTSPTQRAPGANDNGSGTGAVLDMAKVIHALNATFDYTIHFIVYSGEEQGLLGSAAYAEKLVAEKATVIGALNADMIAYRVPSEKLQCAFPSRYSTPALEAIAREAVTTYVPELTIGITTACCSDHQSYYNRGFPATGFFERNGPIADPQYHKSEDLVARTGYDIEGEYTALTRATLATLATVAGVIDQ